MKEISRIAKVEDNRDPEQLGRVKVRIYPEFESLDVVSLPWADPFIEDTCLPGETAGSFRIPEQGSFIIVLIDPTWQEFSYTGVTPVRERKDLFNQITNELSNLTDATVSYPQPIHLLKTKDGAIAYHNSDTGELGIVNKEGIHLLYDSQGNFKLGKKNGFNLIVKANGEFSFKGTVNSEESTLVLYKPLKDILEKLLDHVHVAPNGPTTAAQESNGTPLSVLRANLSTMETK